MKKQQFLTYLTTEDRAFLEAYRDQHSLPSMAEALRQILTTFRQLSETHDLVTVIRERDCEQA